MEGPSFAVPFVLIGRPDGRLTAGCEVCGIFTCSGCAKRDAFRLPLGDGDLDVIAWRLECPLCGSTLGDLEPRRAVLYSAHFGPLAALDTSANPWRLDNGAGALESIKQAVVYHNDKALRLLYVVNTQISIAGSIRFVEMATDESPGEGVVWLYKALLCAKAGYPIASKHGLDQLRVQSNLKPADPVFSQLQLTVLDGNQITNEQITNLAKQLATYSEQLAQRAKKLFNPELAKYHGVVRSYWNSEIRLRDAVERFLVDEARTTPAAQAFIDAFKLEQSLDFSQVEPERARFIELLCHVLDKEQVTELVAKSVAMRLGSISQTFYYLRLEQFAKEKQINLDAFPALQSYFRYISLSSSIDPEALNADLWDGVQAGYRKRIKTVAESLLVDEANRVCLIGRLLDYSQGRLGLARLHGTYAAHPSAFRDTIKIIEAAATEKPPVSFWRRWLSGRSLWRRLFSKRQKL